jgi:acylphosphatase
MSLFRAVRSLILGAPPLASVRLASWTMVSEMPMIYAIQHAAEHAGLNGWLMVSPKGRLEAEMEGPIEDLKEFIEGLNSGKICNQPLPVEQAWGKFQERYQGVRVRLSEVVVHKHHGNVRYA